VRLDAARRRQLAGPSFLNASHPVILRSIDTKESRQYYQLFQPAALGACHFRYADQARMTRGEEGYFWKEEAAGTGPGEQ